MNNQLHLLQPQRQLLQSSSSNTTMITLNTMRIKDTISITMHSKQQQDKQLILTTISSSIMQHMVSTLLSSKLQKVKEQREQSLPQLIMVQSNQSLISEKLSNPTESLGNDREWRMKDEMKYQLLRLKWSNREYTGKNQVKLHLSSLNPQSLLYF